MVTAPGHARLGHDVGFLLVIAGIQHIVRDLALLHDFGQFLGFLDRGGADQHRLASFAAFLDQLDDGVVFSSTVR